MTDWLELVRGDADRFNELINDVPVESRTMFVDADLSNLDLTGHAMGRLDLSGADLSGSTIGGFDLSTCRLQGTRIDEVRFDDEYWRSTIVEIGRLWAGADDWEQGRLDRHPVVLIEADLSGADLESFDLSDASFPAARLGRARLSRTNLDGTGFRGAHLDRATFDAIQCRRLSLVDAVAVETAWTDVEVRHSDFSGADLTGGSFERCTFENVIFNDAVAVSATFEHCVFDECLFFDTDLSGAIFSGCTFNDSDLENGTLDGTIVS
jgi:uncharacterized protein YjbI with pentapeptide repeats